MKIDDTDRKIINYLQEGFPICNAPFGMVADELEVEEFELLARLRRLRKDRVITRFGPFFDAAAMGGAFCLCAMAVQEEDFETIQAKVNEFPEVAHNYERSHRLNMWFVLATETEDEIEAVTMSIERETGLRVLRFPKLREFFIGFRVAA